MECPTLHYCRSNSRKGKSVTKCFRGWWSRFFVIVQNVCCKSVCNYDSTHKIPRLGIYSFDLSLLALTLLSIFKKERLWTIHSQCSKRLWANRSHCSLTKSDCEQIALVALLLFWSHTVKTSDLLKKPMIEFPTLQNTLLDSPFLCLCPFNMLIKQWRQKNCLSIFLLTC